MSNNDKEIAACLRKRNLVDVKLNEILFNDLTMRLERLGYVEPKEDDTEEVVQERGQSEQPKGRVGRPRKTAEAASPQSVA